jgi:L-2-hydroxyglutarate oxidase
MHEQKGITTIGLPATADFVIVGAGVVGLTLALELRARHPDTRIVVLEKEAEAGQHASGRNSGVLHAGFYYSADSLKARFTRDGNQRLGAWCEAHGIAVRRCGKLVVARSAGEHGRLDMLFERAERNGVPMERLSEAEATRIEPRVKTCERALFSPTTASVDPKQVMAALARQAAADGIELVTRARWLGHDGRRVRTSVGEIEAGFLVNAAGLQADRVARAYGFAQHYRILPFKGLYLHGNARAGALRTHVYPVPDLDMPFLGVHFTVAVDGHLHIGPTALPALWLENYGGLGRFSLGEMLGIGLRELRLMLTDASFRRLGFRELRKISRRHLVRHAAELCQGVELEHFDHWGEPGIRAQLLDRRTNELVMDFCTEGDEQSLHVLNAVSPAFTCALPFASHLADELARLTG